MSCQTTPDSETLQRSQTQRKDTCGGTCLKTKAQSVTYRPNERRSLLMFPNPPPLYPQERWCWWFTAWIIGLRVPLRVHSAPWCNSPADAYEEKLQRVSHALDPTFPMMLSPHPSSAKSTTSLCQRFANLLNLDVIKNRTKNKCVCL